MKDFHELRVWEKAHALVLDVYLTTRAFPSDELYGLTSQLRRACVSVTSNIAEGCGRNGDAELARFLQISLGSACEAEYQLLLVKDLGYIRAETWESLNVRINEVKRMLIAFIQTLKN